MVFSKDNTLSSFRVTDLVPHNLEVMVLSKVEVASYANATLATQNTKQCVGDRCYK